VSEPWRESKEIPALSKASYATSSNILCCGSMAFASALLIPKNVLSNNAGSCLIKCSPRVLNYVLLLLT
jgi:hypothetical protein